MPTGILLNASTGAIVCNHSTGAVIITSNTSTCSCCRSYNCNCGSISGPVLPYIFATISGVTSCLTALGISSADLSWSGNVPISSGSSGACVYSIVISSGSMTGTYAGNTFKVTLGFQPANTSVRTRIDIRAYNSVGAQVNTWNAFYDIPSQLISCTTSTTVTNGVTSCSDTIVDGSFPGGYGGTVVLSP